MRGNSLAEGFDVVRKGGGSKDSLSWRFFCAYHGEKIKNKRKLEDRVMVNDAVTVASQCQQHPQGLKRERTAESGRESPPGGAIRTRLPRSKAETQHQRLCTEIGAG